MIADGLLRSARQSTLENDVIAGHWTIDPHQSHSRGRLDPITALTNLEGAVHVTKTELTITAVFDIERTRSDATFPSGTLRARTILWSGEDGLAMGEVSLEGITRTSALDIVVCGYSADPFGDERARIAMETDLATGTDDLAPTSGRLRLELTLVRPSVPAPSAP